MVAPRFGSVVTVQLVGAAITRPGQLLLKPLDGPLRFLLAGAEGGVGAGREQPSGPSHHRETDPNGAANGPENHRPTTTQGGGPGRANVITCTGYLPGDNGSCAWAADPRESGLASGGS